MTRAALVSGLLLGLTACPAPPTPPPAGPLTQALRERALREAEVWHAVDPATLDVHAGPAGSREPGVALECNFVVPHSPPGGKTPKFLCRLPDGSVIKVKYGPDNMEVHGEVFGSRLLWLLGFYSDRIDPVRVRCRGCPEDPWDFLRSLDPSDPRPPPPSDTVREFSPASTESYFGARIEAHPGQGLAWPALLATRSNHPELAATQRLHREALTLLAAFLAHGDSKPGNQTLACHPDGGTPSRCTRSVAYIGDLGSILGYGGKYLMSKVDIEAWADAPVWAEDAPCSAHFRTHHLGTLYDTPISEAARAFLAARLSAVSDAQIRQLFAVAGLDGLGGEVEDEDGTAHPPTLDDWVGLFEAKRREIASRTCPDV